MSEREPGALVALTAEERHEVVMALHERRFETDRYIGSGPMMPCGPGCEHCAPRVAQSQSLHEALVQRRAAIVSALTVFGEGPCDCGLRGGEHWKGDHK